MVIIKQNKYNDSKIYKIVDNTNGNIYIGSTAQTLKERLNNHKHNYKKYLIGKFHYVASFDILKNNDYKIELLESCNVNTKYELELIERKHI